MTMAITMTVILRLLITGDLNIHLDYGTAQYTLKIFVLINIHGLSQLVIPPTYDRGHNLAVVLMQSSLKVPISKSHCSRYIRPVHHHPHVSFHVTCTGTCTR